MRTIAKLASRLNWPRASHAGMPVLFMMSDASRLPEPHAALVRLPRGAALILRHTDRSELIALAGRIVPMAHSLGVRVLLAGTVSDALRLNCDGVHLSDRRARLGPLRNSVTKPGFLITAAAHDRQGLWRAARAGADMVLLSPVFPTASHPEAPVLGPIRFSRLVGLSQRPVVALGGIGPGQAKRLAPGPAWGIAAIAGWSA